jgi:hypothetical protein
VKPKGPQRIADFNTRRVRRCMIISRAVSPIALTHRFKNTGAYCIPYRIKIDDIFLFSLLLPQSSLPSAFSASVLQFPWKHIKDYNRTLWAIRLSLRIVTLAVLPSFLVGPFAADSHVLGMIGKNPYNRSCCFPFSDSASLGSFTDSVSLYSIIVWMPSRTAELC